MLQPKPWRVPLIARDHAETHRQASWLELFFDLSFVVAVAQAAAQLEHALAAGHPGEGLIGYLVVFAAIWWAWVAFTWFANVFDTDDVPYRLLMIAMIAGSLGLAAGVPRIFELDFRIGVISYVVMRLAYVVQWWRVLRTGDSKWRTVAVRVMTLTTINQIGWVLFLWVPGDLKLTVFVLWFAADIATPLLAGWDARMGGHRHHIVERYGLFTIIVLGESVAAATTAIGQAIGSGVAAVPLLALAFGGLVTVCSLWWIYFDFSTGRAPERNRASQYFWSYSHYFVFAALAAVGAGIALSVAWLEDPEQVALADTNVAMVVAVSVGVFLVTVIFIEGIAEASFGWSSVVAKLSASSLAIAAAAAAPVIGVPGSMIAIGLVLGALVAHGVTLQHRLHRNAPPAPRQA